MCVGFETILEISALSLFKTVNLSLETRLHSWMLDSTYFESLQLNLHHSKVQEFPKTTLLVRLITGNYSD